MNKTLYCPVGEPQRKFGVYVTGAGQEVAKPGEPYPHDYHSSDYYFTWDKGRALADWEYQILYIRTGKGVIEFQLALRLRRAANLLANSETPIAQIAKETGFQSPAYFSRFFHKNTGLSPVRYRKRHSPMITVPGSGRRARR